MRLHVTNMIYIYIYESKWCKFFVVFFGPFQRISPSSITTLWNLLNHRFDKRDLLRRRNCKAYLFTPTKNVENSGTKDSKLRGSWKKIADARRTRILCHEQGLVSFWFATLFICPSKNGDLQVVPNWSQTLTGQNCLQKTRRKNTLHRTNLLWAIIIVAVCVSVPHDALSAEPRCNRWLQNSAALQAGHRAHCPPKPSNPSCSLCHISYTCTIHRFWYKHGSYDTGLAQQYVTGHVPQYFIKKQFNAYVYIYIHGPFYS